MRLSREWSVAGAAIGAMLVLPVGCAGPNQAARSGPAARDLTAAYGVEVRDGVERVRAATARFVSLDSAVAAGYTRDVAQCYADDGHGAMGFHHANRGLWDARIEVERPEILLFERSGGRYVLNGVEYIVPYSRWPRDSIAPTVMGQALKRSDDLRLWYLHAWIWTENPSGLFADWHPAVRCPAR